MTTTLRIVLLAAATLIAACGGADDGGGPGTEPDSMMPDSSGLPVPLPTWKLEDVQPLSPRTGQTYGVDTFSSKIVVVTLVEGF